MYLFFPYKNLISRLILLTVDSRYKAQFEDFITSQQNIVEFCKLSLIDRNYETEPHSQRQS